MHLCLVLLGTAEVRSSELLEERGFINILFSPLQFPLCYANSAVQVITLLIVCVFQ